MHAQERSRVPAALLVRQHPGRRRHALASQHGAAQGERQPRPHACVGLSEDVGHDLLIEADQEAVEGERLGLAAAQRAVLGQRAKHGHLRAACLSARTWKMDQSCQSRWLRS
jgi:hypothetical protein